MKINISNKLNAHINKGMIGLFFEDINYGLDGGLHAEMIENRSFEFVESKGDVNRYEQIFDGLYGWSAYPANACGAMLNINTEKPQNDVNVHYLEFTPSKDQMGFANKAYDGVCLKKGLCYKVSFYARTENYKGQVEVLVAKDKRVVVSTVAAKSVTSDWVKYESDFVCPEDVSYGTFALMLNQMETVCFDFISMIPSDAVLGLFRKDLVELLAEVKPGFVRFPGGCIIEGNNLNNRYQWKKSVGKPEQRKSNWNRWAVHENSAENDYLSKYSHYNQTLGIGYFEYFLLCEYIKAKPLPVVNVGLACQYMSNELVQIDDPDFKQFVDDTLDLIEFANGAVDSKWGSVRAQMGHPEPFNLDMIGIGNEQWETEKVDFFKRYKIFEEAIHDKYPSMKLIGSAGPDVTSDKYTAAWDFYYKEAPKNGNFVYAVDEHYYVKPEWLYDNVHFYDKYPRNVKVFAGEYAAHYGYGMNKPELNSWGAALSEAAFLTGVERNADVVVLASYAPLFARLNYTQWSPDMIWFDAENSYASPSFYIQKLYSTLMGTDIVQTSHDVEEIPYSVTYDRNEKTLIVKIANKFDHEITINLTTEFDVLPEAEVYVMTGKENDVNSIEKPLYISPVLESIKVDKNLDYKIGARSFHVIKMICNA